MPLFTLVRGMGFSEAQLQDLAYAPPQEKREDGPQAHTRRQEGDLYTSWCIVLRQGG